MGNRISLFLKWCSAKLNRQGSHASRANIFKEFAYRFDKSGEVERASDIDIEKLEALFSIKLPIAFSTFILTHGNLWTPAILDLVVDKDAEFNDLSQFWSIDSIIFDKQYEWTSSMEYDLIPIGIGSGGSLFAFQIADLKITRDDCPVYFYDHDYDTVEMEYASFTGWIERFNGL